MHSANRLATELHGVFNTLELGRGVLSIFYAVCYIVWYHSIINLMPYFISLQTLPTMVFLRLHLYISLVLFVQTNTSLLSFFTLKLFGGTQSLIRALVQRLEIVRSLVRSLRLGLRILANLTMGHLLISLLYQLPLGSGLFLCFFLYMFELFVGLVQALVFVSLFLIYLRETQE